MDVGKVGENREGMGGQLRSSLRSIAVAVRTMVISFPAAFLNDLVHRTFRGFRFILEKRDTDEDWGVGGQQGCTMTGNNVRKT